MALTRVIILLLFPVIAVSGLALAYSKHLARQAQMELRSLERAGEELLAEWERLQLEESARASHGRIERRAREELGMHMPTSGDIWVVTP
jgi:cell division protein FtsL